MTIRMDAAEVMTAIEVASWVGTMVAMLIIFLLVYLMVRPSRRRREREQALSASEAEEMLRLMARMEQRLEVLERLVVQDANGPDRIRELSNVEKPEQAR